MSPTPSPDNAPPDGPHAESGPAAVYVTEVLVHGGILHATAETLELLHDFFSDTDPVVRIQLGRFLIAYRAEQDTGDPCIEAAILLYELTEAADLLHTLAGDTVRKHRPDKQR
ncbi:MAG: hypothetical protein QOE61_394 [Micromonosporaceae bacterium]|jgi:hypothetical protein|nr:hypothetical protein [Micromonosporaceae bacterium]